MVAGGGAGLFSDLKATQRRRAPRSRGHATLTRLPCRTKVRTETNTRFGTQGCPPPLLNNPSDRLASFRQAQSQSPTESCEFSKQWRQSSRCEFNLAHHLDWARDVNVGSSRARAQGDDRRKQAGRQAGARLTRRQEKTRHASGSTYPRWRSATSWNRAPRTQIAPPSSGCAGQEEATAGAFVRRRHREQEQIESLVGKLALPLPLPQPDDHFAELASEAKKKRAGGLAA